jgi:hypothetical protein
VHHNLRGACRIAPGTVRLWTKFGLFRLTLNQEQIPQIIEKQIETKPGRDWLDEFFLRPGQVR